MVSSFSGVGPVGSRSNSNIDRVEWILTLDEGSDRVFLAVRNPNYFVNNLDERDKILDLLEDRDIDLDDIPLVDPECNFDREKIDNMLRLRG